MSALTSKKRKNTIYCKRAGFITAALFSLFFIACGGGGSNSNNGTPTISISPTTASTTVGIPIPFTVTARNTDFTVSAPSIAACVKTGGNTVTCTPTETGTHTVTVTATESPYPSVSATLTVNPARVPVPSVSGKTEAEAISEITGAGLTVAYPITYAFSINVPEGRVISQNPTAGISVDAGTAVNITVSLGRETPDFYTVTFVTNGGSSVAALTEVTSIPSEPSTSRPGYDFDGWFTASNFSGSRITFPYTVTGDITLYAKWIQMDAFELIYDDIDLLAKLTANLSGSFRLAADISLAAYSNWVPIGTESAPFMGKIDGNGYKISNLKIYRPAEIYMGSFGLFGNVDGGTITNLALENVDIVGGQYSGAIAGRITNSTITNSYTTGNISTSDVAGGFAGSFGYVSITDSYSTVNINAISSAGGIIGELGGGTITGNYSTGNISAINSSFSGVPGSGGPGYAGGIAGSVNGGIITNSYSTGNINASSSAGGIAGIVFNSGTITDSCSTGNISVSSSVIAFFAYAGGIVGDYGGSASGTITNSCSTGDVSASSSVSGSSAYAGGIAGRVSSGAITNSFSKGFINASSSSQTGYVGVISATAIAGGIAGYIYGGTYSGSKITNSYSTGNINASSFDTYSSSTSVSYAGGIAGRVGRAIITNNYSIGNISASAPASASSAYAGGISGYSSEYGFTITGNAAINKNITAGDYAGRIAGNIFVAYGYVVVVENNLALDAMADPGIAKFNSTNIELHGVDRSDAQLKTQSTYSDAINGNGLGGLGWKFGNDDDNPWQMPVGGGYPIFYWQE